MLAPRFAVVGAGLGGLTLGILLQRAGYECRIYEQAPAIGRVGAGINIAPNSTRLFASLGLEKALRKVGIEPQCKFSRHFETGDVMLSVPVKELTELYNAPFFAFHRADLHDVLFSVLKPGTVKTGKKLSGLSRGTSGWSLEFEDGSSVQADSVIGADGVHSRVRAAITDEDPVSYHGLVAYRAIVPKRDISVAVADNTKWWAPDRYVQVYHLSERRDAVHFVASTPEPLNGGMLPGEANLAAFHAAFAGFHPEVTKLLQAADNVTRWPLIEGRRFEPWHKDELVLLGDACHATTPHMGQGAGMAFEDAFVLARCIEAQNCDLSAAFAQYERNRIERVSRIQKISHDNNWSKSSIDHQWVYGYDAMSVPLIP